MYKHTIPSIFPLISSALTWKVNTTDKVLYLTFDDGPHPSITPKVLSVLKQYNAKATFFCVGDNVRKCPEVYEQILTEGHQTGNHTFNHLSGWKTDNQHYFDNIHQASTLIKSGLFRPPYGQISPKQIAVLKKQYRIVMWSILTRDYERNLNKEKASKSILKHTKAGDVIVFHDSERAEKNLFYILPQLLEKFSHEGYQFKTL
jgi:peptidoglycan/xylan/chitin deacetylase (PgdA/CDA1 family)